MRAQEGYGTCLVCACVYVCMYVRMYVCMYVRMYIRMSVCMCVTTLAATSVVSALKMRYVGGYFRLFSVKNSWIFDAPAGT